MRLAAARRLRLELDRGDLLGKGLGWKFDRLGHLPEERPTASRPPTSGLGPTSPPKAPAGRPLVAGMLARADRSIHHSAPRGARGENRQRDADLVEVDTGAVAEVAMIAERFSMVRCDDHHCVVEESLSPVAGQAQSTNLIIEESDAIVNSEVAEPRRMSLFNNELLSICIILNRKS